MKTATANHKLYIMIPSINDLMNSVKIHRELGLTNDDEVFSIKASNKEFERQAKLTFKRYEDEHGVEEFLTLTIQDEEWIKPYVFEPKREQVKQLREMLGTFLSTGEMLQID